MSASTTKPKFRGPLCTAALGLLFTSTYIFGQNVLTYRDASAFACLDCASGVNRDAPIVTSGPVSLVKSYTAPDGSTLSVNDYAISQAGILSARASATMDLKKPLVGYGAGSARFQSGLTFSSSALNGKPGKLYVRYRLSGTASNTGAAKAFGQVAIKLGNDPFHIRHFTSASGLYWPPTPHRFIWGQALPFNVSLTALAGSMSPTPSGYAPCCASGAGSGSADFSNNLEIDSFTVTDEQGLVVNSAVLNSTDGRSYPLRPEIPANPGPNVVSLYPESAGGLTASPTAMFTHGGGATQHYLGYILFLPTPNIVQYTAAGSCLVEYNRISHAMRLINEAGDNWLGPVSGVPLSQGGTLTNSRCTLDVGASSAQVIGTNMIVKPSVTFKPGFDGVLGTFLQALDVNEVWTGMTQFGNWVPAAASVAKSGPFVVGMSPTSGAGSSATFGITAGHTGGVAALSMIHFRMNSTIVGGSPCHVVYFPGNNTLNLITDDETALVSPTGVTPGTAALSNGRCRVGAGSSRSGSGNNVSLTLPMTFFTEGFAGLKNMYINAFDTSGNLTHWVQGGSWTVQ